MADVWLNNLFVDENAASISIRDAGLLHGAGVFTTMRAHDGRVVRIAQHLRRLRDSCEALWFNVHSYLQPGSISNVFIVEDSKLVTPPTPQELRQPDLAQSIAYARSNVLPGVTRAAVLELARSHELPVEIAPIDVNRLLGATEVLLTNSIMDVMPVCRIEQKAVGDERPGPITLQLANGLREQM